MTVPVPASAPAPQRRPRVHLDHAASSPVRAEVAEQVAEDLRSGLGGWANPAAQHASGRRAGALLAQARARIAAVLNADPHEVLLTSGGTEADALAVTGRVLAARARGSERPRVVTSAVEHPAVLDTARTAAAHLGAEHLVLGCLPDGRVEPASLEAALADPSPIAVLSVMTANNETGAVEDIAALVALVRERRAASPGLPGYVPVHSDAVAAVGKVPVDFDGWRLDALSITGHKIGAPVGVGALVARRDLELVAPTGGGRQERGVRSGTQDVVGARALALAAELAVRDREALAARHEALCERLLAGALALPGAHATLPAGAPHLPGTAHLWFEDLSAEALLMGLDLAGVDASAGSACHAGVTQPSHVLLAMGLGDGPARATLRISMGPDTTEEDINRLLAALPAAVGTARRAAGAGRH